MVDSFALIILVVLGLCAGSFAGALTWRLRARQLQDDQKEGIKVNKSEYARLKTLLKNKLINDRSRCLECSYKLKWYDLIPVFSWLYLRGRCRQCKHKIGWLEPLIELGVAAFFVASYIFWPSGLETPLEIIRFAIWLISGVGLAVLFAYDLKWLLLPDRISFAVIGLGLANVVAVLVQTNDYTNTLVNVFGAGLILSGLYLLLNIASRGRWVGFGDVKLGLGLALLIADWRLAFLALFAANLIGTLMVVPAMFAGKIKANSHVPLGPLLILGAVLTVLFGQAILDIYLIP